MLWTESRCCRAFVARHPHRELDLRRLYRENADMRSLVCDFSNAMQALDHWRTTFGMADHRTLDYQRLVQELEIELLERLDNARPGVRIERQRLFRPTEIALNPEPKDNH